MSVRRREIRRLEAPYGSDCYWRMPALYGAFGNSTFNYTIDECQLACTDYHLQAQCACVDSVGGRREDDRD